MGHPAGWAEIPRPTRPRHVSFVSCIWKLQDPPSTKQNMTGLYLDWWHHQSSIHKIGSCEGQPALAFKLKQHVQTCGKIFRNLCLKTPDVTRLFLRKESCLSQTNHRPHNHDSSPYQELPIHTNTQIHRHTHTKKTLLDVHGCTWMYRIHYYSLVSISYTVCKPIPPNPQFWRILASGNWRSTMLNPSMVPCHVAFLGLCSLN